MKGRRDSSSTIWRTVVFAGAMLGCGGAPSATHPAAPMPPQNTAPTNAPTPEPAAEPTTKPADPVAAPATNPGDPCNGVIVPPQTAQPNPEPATEPDPPPTPKKRPRGGGDRPTGRGFVLA